MTSGTSAWWLVIDGNGDWEEVSESANGTLRCDYYENTRKMASTRWEAGSTIPASAPTNITSVSTAGFIHGESYYYDILGRVVLTTDSRTGTRVTNQVSPIADEIYQTIDSASRTTWYFYDHRGRLKEVRLPGYSPSGGSANDPLVTFTSYEIDGKVKSVEGGQTYKVEYGYDFARRMTSMTTYGTTMAVTTWSYNPDGRLIQKFYADGPDAGSDPDPGPEYTYTDFGRLKKKIWARGNTTRYDYDNDGRLIRELHFSSGTSQLTVDGASSGNDANTPDHHYGWDVLGRPTSVDNGRAIYEYDYDATTLQLSSETIEIDPDGSGGAPAVTRVIERSRDAILRSGRLRAEGQRDGGGIGGLSLPYRPRPPAGDFSGRGTELEQ